MRGNTEILAGVVSAAERFAANHRTLLLAIGIASFIRQHTNAQLQAISEELRNWEELREYSVPLARLLAAGTLRNYICSITSRPIRFVVVIRGAAADVYYERRALVGWIRRSVEGSPPGWPVGVPVPRSESAVLSSRSMQRVIDRHLREFANVWLRVDE